MSNIATTIEQSKRLLELGLNPKTADMCLCKSAQDTWFLCAYTPGSYDAHTVPAWSLSALLEVMPKRVDTNCLKLERGLLSDKWFCQYWGGEFFANEDPVTASYEMVCWLLEQGLIKKGDNDDSKD